jgi:hypothetical protein
MLKHAAERAHGVQRGREGAAVVSLAVPPAGFDQPRQPTPARTGWMRDDGKGAGVQARVALFVPRVNVGKSDVATTRFDEKRRDQWAPHIES